MVNPSLVRALEYVKRNQQVGWTLEYAAQVIESQLKTEGVTLVGGVEDPLPMRTQGAIEIRDIFQNFLNQGFMRSEAMELTVTVLTAESTRS